MDYTNNDDTEEFIKSIFIKMDWAQLPRVRIVLQIFIIFQLSVWVFTLV